jgi:endo-1,4-beta-mannosidase
MGWWTDFDAAEVGSDFERIAAAGFDSVRLFLTWEDFQPAPNSVDTDMLDRLVTVTDVAGREGLAIMPTLFTGHMSGVNWIPAWALGGSNGDDRFRVVSGGRSTESGLRNWYTDPEVGAAQVLLARAAATALAGHGAVWAWDLGNENSNCVKPPRRSQARDWLKRTTAAIRTADPAVLITMGLHMEDLEEDRMLGPAEAGEVCDFLTMHGYPIYARWAAGPTDEHLPPFLAHMTRWLGGGCDVLFSEFGLPTYLRPDLDGEEARHESSAMLVDEPTVGLDPRERRLDAADLVHVMVDHGGVGLPPLFGIRLVSAILRLARAAPITLAVRLRTIFLNFRAQRRLLLPELAFQQSHL